MQSMANLMYKLQTALKVKGYIVTINTHQFYSQQQDRFIKMYTLKHDKKEIENTSSQIIIIRTLKQILDTVTTLEATRVERAQWESAVQEDLKANYNTIHNTNI